MVTFFDVDVEFTFSEEAAVVLVELNLVEQRYQAVLEVLNDGASVTDVARRPLKADEGSKPARVVVQAGGADHVVPDSAHQRV